MFQRRLFSALVRRHFQTCKLGLSTQADESHLDLFQPQAVPKYENAIEFKTAPKQKRSRRSSSNPRKTVKKFEGRPLIDCSRPEFNHYVNQTYGLKEIPLATKGWHHYKSKGDHFTIKLYEDDVDMSNYFNGEMETFEGLNLNENIVAALRTLGFNRPTSIQEKSIPSILSGRNTLIAAETGCGKTLAYLLPVIQQVLRWKQSLKDRPPNSPLALVMCPSRELAEQIGVPPRVAKDQLKDSSGGWKRIEKADTSSNWFMEGTGN